MSVRLFTSDLHFGHLLMARLRGFASVEEHDKQLIANWNDRVTPRDTVLVAGDVAMGKKHLHRVGELNGSKVLISGNHDECWPGKENSWTHTAAYQKYFDLVTPFVRIRMANQLVLVSHFPYDQDRTDPPRYNQYRLRNEGNWLLHGHTHSRIRRTSAREVHIGLDAWDLFPVSERSIVQIIASQVRREEKGEARILIGAQRESACTSQVPPASRPAAETGREHASAGGCTGAEGKAGNPVGDTGCER